MNQEQIRVAILACCFNRKAVTLAGLQSLAEQTGLDNIDLTIYLVDDGSTDGTAEAVSKAFPYVKLIAGTGSLWWNGANRLALQTALETGYDAYIIWNDDTHLRPDAVSRLVASADALYKEHGPGIVTGSVLHPQTQLLTFGGIRMIPRGLHLDYSITEPSMTEAILCDTVNGNFTLIHDEVVRKIGNFDPGFVHLYGDWDFGFRAKYAGFPVIIAPGYFGTCATNTTKGTWLDAEVPLAERWKKIMSPRGIVPREALLYTRRHYGWRWPLYFVSPYVRCLFPARNKDRMIP